MGVCYGFLGFSQMFLPEAVIGCTPILTWFR
jgi:hypothetical protein